MKGYGDVRISGSVVFTTYGENVTTIDQELKKDVFGLNISFLLVHHRESLTSVFWKKRVKSNTSVTSFLAAVNYEDIPGPIAQVRTVCVYV